MKILLADDHEIFRKGMHHLLSERLDEQIIEAKDYDEVNNICEQENIDLILIDIGMPGAKGLEGILKLRQKYIAIKIIVVSGLESSDIISTLLKNGCQGFVLKSQSAEVVSRAVDQVLAGDVYVPSTIMLNSKYADIKTGNTGERVTNDAKMFSITDREQQVLELIVQGYSNKEIARELGISLATVRTHTISIYRSLNVNNRAQAGYIATKYALV